MPPDAEVLRALIDEIAETPAIIRVMVQPLTELELQRSYRADGWTIRQLVHHLPDSHMHTYVHMKLAVTSESPMITAYDEDQWAKLPDVRLTPVAISLDLLAALHQRWVAFLHGLTEWQLHRTYVHPEWGPVPVFEAIAMYAWHGRHHAAHIRNALRRS